MISVHCGIADNFQEVHEEGGRNEVAVQVGLGRCDGCTSLPHSKVRAEAANASASGNNSTRTADKHEKLLELHTSSCDRLH